MLNLEGDELEAYSQNLRGGKGDFPYLNLSFREMATVKARFLGPNVTRHAELSRRLHTFGCNLIIYSAAIGIHSSTVTTTISSRRRSHVLLVKEEERFDTFYYDFEYDREHRDHYHTHFGDVDIPPIPDDAPPYTLYWDFDEGQVPAVFTSTAQ